MVACLAVGLIGNDSADAEENILDDSRHFAHIVDKVIAPGYAKLDEYAALHRDAINSLCSQPRADELLVARNTWRRVKIEWKRVQVTAIGPAMKMRTHRSIDFWPHRQPLVERILASNIALTSETMATQSVAAKGLNVLEHYLFDEYLLKAISANERICEYLAAVADDVAIHLTKLHEYWTVGSRWRSALLAFDGKSVQDVITFASPHEAWQELFNVVLSATYNIRKLSLIKSAGLRLHTRPRPELAEGRASRSSVELIRAGVEGLYEIIVFPQSGIADLLTAQGQADVADELSELVGDAVAAAVDLREPFIDSIHEQRELIEALDATLRRVQMILQTETPQIFDIVMYFRDLDGD